MERDPILFAWRAAPRRHAVAAAVAVGLGGPACLLTLLCLRDLVGVLMADESAVMPFLRAVVPLPGTTPDLILSHGWPLKAGSLEVAAFVGVALGALVLAGLGWFLAFLSFRAQALAALSLRAAVTNAIIEAPPASRDDVRALPGLVGSLLTRMDGLFATAIVVPALALGGIALAVLAAAMAAPRLVPAAGIGLLAGGLARLLILRRSAVRAELRQRESASAEMRLADLVRRLPAVRAHGAGGIERQKLAEQARAAKALIARAEARLAYARAPALALAVILPALGLGAALWRGPPDEIGPAAVTVEPGSFVAAVGAFTLALVLMSAAMRVFATRDAIAPTFGEIARILNGLTPRRPRPGGQDAPFPRRGELVARGVGGYDPASGERLSGVDVAIAMPGHVAITGGRGSGARVLAAILAGQVEPTAGSLTYGGAEMRAFDPSERARRIAYASGEAVLVEGSLRRNILYGADPARPPDEAALVAILSLTGLDAFAYARGLLGRVDPVAEPDLAGKLLGVRRRIRQALAAEGAERLVEPFDPARYNHQATIGENILFGEAVGTAFSGENLARHPYLRGVLEAEGLTRPLIEVGLQVASSTVEIFSDLPNDHPLFDAFSLFPANERGYFEDLVGRHIQGAAWRRGPAGQRDRERLIGLALRYSETRHRFGLIDEAFEERLVEARHSFSRMLPPTLRAKVELYDPARINAAASLEENLLFGRIAYGEAGAEARVRGLARRILAEQGLEQAVYRLGLDSKVEPGPASSLGEGAVGARERVAIDVARCLARVPDILVVALFLDERKPEEFRERLQALRAMRRGLGLVICLPDDADAATLPPFDATIAVERNTVAAQAAPVLEPA